VVGAFRSGKSFLLTFFLRYLRNGSSEDLSEAWLDASGERLNEGNVNDGDSAEKEDPHGFAWRGGQERQTTGIWMWSEPFIWRSAGGGEPFAVLLMDTQGMFDNKTTMDGTVQVFGLSTLVSSYQIYNVDKRIQEDNLQHLACFSEYGRMALGGAGEEEGEGADSTSSSSSSSAAAAAAAADDSEATASGEDGAKNKDKAKLKKGESKKQLKEKPFQRLEFLVRDWQNFDAELGEEGQSAEEESETYAGLKKEMDSYFAEVVNARKSADLKVSAMHTADNYSYFLIGIYFNKNMLLYLYVYINREPENRSRVALRRSVVSCSPIRDRT
jgi:atlastin